MQSSPASFHRRSLSEFSGKLPAIVSRPASSFYLHTLWQPHQLRTSPPHRVPFTPAHPLATPFGVVPYHRTTFCFLYLRSTPTHPLANTSRTLSDLETHGLRFTPRSLWRSSLASLHPHSPSGNPYRAGLFLPHSHLYPGSPSFTLCLPNPLAAPHAPFYPYAPSDNPTGVVPSHLVPT